MNKIFCKKLTRSELDRHYIRVNKRDRPLFPPAGVPFTAIVGKTRIEMIIDKYDRIYIQYRFWDSLREPLDIEEGDTMVFSKNPDGTFTISVQKPPKNL
jgi:hypothetical protein